MNNPNAARYWIRELADLHPRIDALREKLRPFTQRPPYVGADPELDPLLALASTVCDLLDPGTDNDDD
jgi:hypothetical protein